MTFDRLAKWKLRRSQLALLDLPAGLVLGSIAFGVARLMGWGADAAVATLVGLVLVYIIVSAALTGAIGPRGSARA